MERCWCDEERALYSTKGEKVSPLTEARSARSWCDEERALYSTKAEKGAGLTRKSDRTARVREGEHPGERASRSTKCKKIDSNFSLVSFSSPFFKGTDENLKFFPLTKGDARGIFRMENALSLRDTPLKEGN